MICQKCRAEVADDLTFCTNCGERLRGDSAGQPPPPVPAGTPAATSAPAQNPPAKSNSNLKWAALIVALIALPASLGIVYLLVNSQRNSQVAGGRASPPPAARKPAAANNSSKPPPPANVSNTAGGTTNSNSAAAANQNANSAVDGEGVRNKPGGGEKRSSIFDERIALAPDEKAEYSFTLDTEAKFFGGARVLEGGGIEAYVYFQEMYDQHFPDPTYKVFGMEGGNFETEQTLVAGDYVLVFVNKTQTAVVLQGNFYTVK